MQTLFWTLSIAGASYFLLTRRRYDWFATAFFAGCVYFLPGFFGYTAYLTLFGWNESPMHPEAYGVMIAVLASILGGALLSDLLPVRKGSARDQRGDSRTEQASLVPVLLLLALTGLVMMLLTTGAALFDVDKLDMLEGLNRWYILFYTATMLGSTLAFAFRRWAALICFSCFILFDVFIGFRATLAVTSISIFTLWLSEQGAKRLLKAHWRPLLAGLAIAFLLFFLKEMQFAMKYGDAELVRSIVGNPDTYRVMFVQSEPFICQSTLNEVVTQNYHVGMEHLKGVLYQFVLFAPELGLEAVSFNDLFQPDLFPGTAFYGMANNIWAEMWSAGGWPLLSVFLLLFVSGLKFFSVLTAGGKTHWRGIAAVLASYWAFYLHRNDISYELALLKRVVLVAGLALIITAAFEKVKGIVARAGAVREGRAGT